MESSNSSIFQRYDYIFNAANKSPARLTTNVYEAQSTTNKMSHSGLKRREKEDAKPCSMNLFTCSRKTYWQIYLFAYITHRCCKDECIGRKVLQSLSFSPFLSLSLFANNEQTSHLHADAI